ncbi:MAG TPA: hypothetical protein VMB50_10725 [Myxococcales bacterium]|nr:hypothetical protein [Myxococcales bacterium]
MNPLVLALWLAAPPPPPPPLPPAAPHAVAAPAAPAVPDRDDDDDEPEDRGPRHDVTTTGSVTIHAGERVRDVVALGGSVDVQGGGAARDAVAIGGSVHVEQGGVVDRDAVAVGGSVKIDDGGRVGRDVTSVGGTVQSEHGAVVGRDRVGLGLPGLGALLALATGILGVGALFSPLWLIGTFVAKLVVFLACGLILLALWPRRLEVVAAELTRATGRSVLLGCAAAVLLPPLAVLFAITIIGIPLALLEAVGVAVATALGYSALALLVGRRLPFGTVHPAIQLTVGWVLLDLLFLIPILGFLLMLAVWVWTFGAVLASRFGREAAPPALPPVPPPAVPA